MAKNTLVINCDIGETRVALIENGILAELHVERKSARGLVGNIYLGKVSRVLPGMQAAFIDIGEERAAFLHVEDLIRPADFEAYLAGSKRREGGEDDAEREPAEPQRARAERGERGERHEKRGRGERRERAPEPTAVEPEVEEALEAEAGVEAEGEEVSREALEAVEESTIERLKEAQEVEREVEAEHEAGRSTVDAIRPATPVEEPDAPVLRTAREEDEVVEKRVRDDADMATRRRRRRGGRSGAKRQDIEADAKAEEGVVAEGAASAAADVEGEEGDEGEEGAEREEGRSSSFPPPPPQEARPARSVRPPRPAREPRGEEGEAAERSPAPPAVAGEEGERVSPLPPPVAAAGEEGARTTPAPERREGRERGRDRGRDRGRGERPSAPAKDRGGDRGAERGAERGGERGADRGGDRGRRDRDGSLRLGRSTPINEVVREGQEVIVQVTKDPIGTKGARVSSHVSLPGRYVVYMPTVEHIGVSRRIGSDMERRRLREAIESMKPPQGGLIVRTVAEGLTKKQLKADVGYLVRLWGEIAKKKEAGATEPKPTKAPTLLFQELDVVLRTARDMFTDDIEKIVIDDPEQYQRLKRFIEMFMPERTGSIELYQGDEPIFDAYGLEDEIARALSRKVPLPSGGYLIIDQAEALTAIDVNSGRYVGKGNKDPEDTILNTNLEAVQEIAYQLRFRNIGGLIVLDLIDMERASNREKVYRALEQALTADKAKTSINRISELGLVEMTRKRTRESLGRTLHEACFYCDGTGQLQSRTTIAYEILRQIRRERMSIPGYKVIVNAHPSVVDLLQSDERQTLREAEKRYQRQIMLVPHKEYHIEQFDLAGA